MHTYRIAVLPGDGIGPEVTAQAVLALQAAARRFGFAMDFAYADVGGEAYEKHGHPLPDGVLPLCRACDAVLLGAVGGTQWDDLPPALRPEQALFGLRAGLGLYANLRPAQLHEALKAASPLRADILGDGLDILIVRELTGGIYFGERGRTQIDGAQAAYDTELYSVPEVERIARMGFECAMKRGGRLCSVDKANVLESSRLWREVVSALAAQYPQVELTHMLVDNAAMQLVRNPRQFDVIVTSNIFGDILSDEASQLTGSIGMLPSASLGERGGMYEPVHGSAPDIAGQDIANPLAAIGSAAMLLRYTLGLSAAADAVQSAVSRALGEGLRTVDIAAGVPAVGTRRMGAAVAAFIESE